MTALLKRRKFLTQLARFTSVLAAGVFFAPAFSKSKTPTKPIKIARPKRNGITITDKFIVVKNNNNFSVFSRKCTHLGCDLSLDSKGGIACPCHGSKFSTEGLPLYGPAKTPLVKLKLIKIDSKFLHLEFND